MSALTPAEKQQAYREREATKQAQLVTAVATLTQENQALRAELEKVKEQLHEMQLKALRAKARKRPAKAKTAPAT